MFTPFKEGNESIIFQPYAISNLNHVFKVLSTGDSLAPLLVGSALGLVNAPNKKMQDTPPPF
jgi:hypothetical protein